MARRNAPSSEDGRDAPLATDQADHSNDTPRLLGWVAKGLEFVALALMAVMALHIVLDVTLSALFASPMTGTLEIVGHYYMVAIIILPLAALHLADQHISADLFTARAGPRIRRVIEVLSNLALAGFASVIVWKGVELACLRTSESEHIMVSQLFVYVWPSRWLVPVGFGLLALVALSRAASAFRHGPAVPGRQE